MAPATLQHLSRCRLPPERNLTQHSVLQLARVLQLALQRIAGVNQHSALVIGKLAAAAQAQRTYIASLRACVAAASQAQGSDPEDAHAGASRAVASDDEAGLLAMLAELRGSRAGGTHDAPADVAHQHTHQMPDCAVNSVDELLLVCAAHEAAYSAALAAVQAAQQALREQVRTCNATNSLSHLETDCNRSANLRLDVRVVDVWIARDQGHCKADIVDEGTLTAR